MSVREQSGVVGSQGIYIYKNWERKLPSVAFALVWKSRTQRVCYVTLRHLIGVIPVHSKLSYVDIVGLFQSSNLNCGKI